MKVVLIAILLVGATLRLLWLGNFPAGVSGDEVGQGYTAYSILKTGHDEWGEFLPLFPRGFGDYKGPILSYITIPSIAIFGLNEFAIRLPIAIVGILTILVTYFLAKEWFKAEKIALWSAFLIAINPWHIQLSRTAFEGTVGILFFSVGFWAYLKAREKKNHLFLTAIFWGLSLYTYHSFKLFIPTFALAIFVFDHQFKNVKRLIFPLIVFILFVLPIVLNSSHTTSRFNDVSILKESKSEELVDRKFFAPDKFFRIITANPVVFVSEKFINNYLSYFSLPFYFTGSRSDSSYLNFPYTNLLYLIELPFIFAFFAFVVLKDFKKSYYALIWILLAPLPAAIASSEGSANRSITFLPMLPIISAVGLTYLLTLLNNNFRLKPIYTNIFLVSALCLGLFFFLFQYIYYIPNKRIESIRYGYKQVFTTAIQNENNYQKIVFSHHFTNPQIYVAFFKQIDPAIIQKESQNWLRYEMEGKLYVDQLSQYNLENYEFRDIAWNDDRLKTGYLFIGSRADFPSEIESIYDYKDKLGNVIYRVVPSDINKDRQI